MSAQLGSHVYKMNSNKIVSLSDSAEMWRGGDITGLRHKLNEDGYLYIKGLIPQTDVIRARDVILSHMKEHGLIEPDTRCTVSTSETVAATTDQGKLDVGDLTRTPAVLGVLEHHNLRTFFAMLFGEDARTFDYKWLRAVKHGEASGFHTDSVYMGNGSPRLLTCWIPFMDINTTKGGLVVLPGSHNAPSLNRFRETYSQMDVDRDNIGGTGWFSEDPEEVTELSAPNKLRWATGDMFQPGDVVVFQMNTVHGSAVNRTKEWRISCDVRWQPASDPVDRRWVFDDKGTILGHTKFNQRHSKMSIR
eukprot:PhF_6_TR3302/c0_g1_i1/m.4653